MSNSLYDLKPSRRGSGDSATKRKDSNFNNAPSPSPPKIVGVSRKTECTLDYPSFRQEQRPSTSSTASESIPILFALNQVDNSCQALPPPTIITSSVTPPATSPTAPKCRRDSTTQCNTRAARRDSKVSPEKISPRISKLQRQVSLTYSNNYEFKYKYLYE